MLPLFTCLSGLFLGLYFDVLVLLVSCLIGSAGVRLLSACRGVSAYTPDLAIWFFGLFWGRLANLGLAGREVYVHILARFHAAQSNRI